MIHELIKNVFYAETYHIYQYHHFRQHKWQKLKFPTFSGDIRD